MHIYKRRKNEKMLQPQTATPRSPKRIRMNFSRSSWIGNETECKSFFLKTVSLLCSFSLPIHPMACLVACPFTILLNALVMIAVKTKRRLQTHPNILLACLRFILRCIRWLVCALYCVVFGPQRVQCNYNIHFFGRNEIQSFVTPK